jgi:hypothetical protein
MKCHEDPPEHGNEFSGSMKRFIVNGGELRKCSVSKISLRAFIHQIVT